MLKSLVLVTLMVTDPDAVARAYGEHLGYATLHAGRVSADQAELWAAPAMTGQRFAILGPPSREAVFLRLVAAPAGAPAPPAPGTTHGWNAVEFLVRDPDGLQAQLAPGFSVIGPPRNLWAAPSAPRAMQALGPAGELVYFTRVDPAGFARPMRPAASNVDRVFIVVVGGPSMDALRAFYGAGLGLSVSAPAPFPITTLSRALTLPATTTYPLATAALARDFLVELDEYPVQAAPRVLQPGALPGGVAMVGFAVASLDDLAIPLRAPPRRIAEFPYSGQRAGVAVGPAGEWLEFIETAGLATAAPGNAIPD